LKRIVVSVTNNIATDQRVQKMCTTLQTLNFEILVIGSTRNGKLNFDSNYKTLVLPALFKKGFLFYAEYSVRLFLILLFTKKDILLANDLDTLLPNYLISILQHKPLVYDSHELFTEVPELIDRKFVQNFWLRLERLIVPNLKYCITVSDSISTYYKNKYHTNFITVPNYPIKITSEIKAKLPFKTYGEKIILYQGALNKGRGLELIIEAMPYIENTLLVIIGSGDIEQNLQQKVKDIGLDNTVKFINKTTPNKLKKITPLADLGISLEEELGLNYKYALPNKLFDYIQAKIPVLVSNLPEMKQIVLQYKVGEVVSERTPQAIAQQIKFILQNKVKYTKNIELAAIELVWEKEEPKIIELFKLI
jgi:glycosyltransferase involved in cell wall biosynthesis